MEANPAHRMTIAFLKKFLSHCKKKGRDASADATPTSQTHPMGGCHASPSAKLQKQQDL